MTIIHNGTLSFEVIALAPAGLFSADEVEKNVQKILENQSPSSVIEVEDVAVSLQEPEALEEGESEGFVGAAVIGITQEFGDDIEQENISKVFEAMAKVIETHPYDVSDTEISKLGLIIHELSAPMSHAASNT